ncbi:MAG: hypothetical protein RLP44_19450 [Aggregatilineales bacterium]
MDDIQPNSTHQSKFGTLIIDAWCETGESSQVIWRFRVRDVRTGERQTFAKMDSLLDYLRDQFNSHPAEQ